MTFVPLSRLTSCFVWPQLTENPSRTTSAEFRLASITVCVVLLKQGLTLLTFVSPLLPVLPLSLGDVGLGSSSGLIGFDRLVTKPPTPLTLGALMKVYRISMGLLLPRKSTLFCFMSRPVFGWLRTACELTTVFIWNVTCLGKPVPTPFATTSAAGCRAVTITRTFIVSVSRVTCVTGSLILPLVATTRLLNLLTTIMTHGTNLRFPAGSSPRPRNPLPHLPTPPVLVSPSRLQCALTR